MEQKNINYTIIMAEKNKIKNHVLKSNNKVLAFNIKLNLQQQLRF